MRSLLVGLAVLAGCGPSTVAPGPVAPMPTPAPVVPPVAPPPHADFANLRPFHNYYRVLAVGEYRHHFVAFYHHLELVTALYDVPVTPGAAVHQLGTGFGLITERPPSEPVPAAVAPIAAAIEADIQAREPEASGVQVLYLGAFRTVEVEEIVVRPPSPGRGERYSLRSTLAAGEDLTSITGTAAYYTGMGGDLRLDDVREHADVPAWIDAGLGRQGRAGLWNLYATPSLLAADARAAFEAATLASARRLIAGEPGLALADLAVERDRRVLPADLEAHRKLNVYVNADDDHGRHQSSAASWIVPARIFGGEERAAMRLSIPTPRNGDVLIDAEVSLRGAPIPAGADGELELPVTIDYLVTATGARRQPFAGTTTARARVIVDGDRVHVLEFPDGIPAHTFAAFGGYTGFEVHLGFMTED